MRSRLLLAALCFPALLPAQWQMQTSNTTADLRGIHSVGKGVAWASGTHGTVLRTEDGGYVWQTCAVPPGAEKLDFRGIQAFDANTAIVMSSGPGDQSRLYKTTDGCHTWTLVFTNPDAPDGFFDAIQFRSRSREGVLIGDPVAGHFAIFRSSDRGSHWRAWGTLKPGIEDVDHEKIPQSAQGESLFAASNQSLSVWDGESFIFVTGGRSGPRMYYADDGNAWCTEITGKCSAKFDHQDLHGLSSGASAGAFAIASPSFATYFPLKLMIVGGDYTTAEQAKGTALFLESENGTHLPFTPWFSLQVPTTPPHGYRSSVAYDQQQKLWITVGPNGTDISSDDGKNWRAVHPDAALHEAADADRNWNALSLPFVVGPHGRIGRLEATAVKPSHP